MTNDDDDFLPGFETLDSSDEQASPSTQSFFSDVNIQDDDDDECALSATVGAPTHALTKKEGVPQPIDRGPFGRLMNNNFLQYASYVICDRALPAVEDGLKPVQRRILHALWEKDDGRFSKVAGIVGNTMQYHPHGDASIKDAIVTLANKRYLIQGQGNFGNIFTGDGAAAGRYIECRLTKIAKELLFSEKITPFVPSYDGRNQEPVILPAKIPLLLMLGVDGIAVGLSTYVMPHNFIELLEAEIAVLQKKPFLLLPDFLTGGKMDASDYEDGNGFVKVRAIFEERHNEKNKLYITGIPWSTTTERLIDSIEKVLKTKRIPIRNITDFTSNHVEIELTLSPGSDPDKVKKSLYAFTDCEKKISSRLVVLKDNRPCVMTVTEVLQHNVQRLLTIFEQEFNVRLKEINALLLKKTLERIFIEERIYKHIEQVKEADVINQTIRDGFIPFKDQLLGDLTDEDIEMLLRIQIRRISLYDINKHREEVDALNAEHAEISDNLIHLKRYTIKFLKGVIKRYAKDFPRLTEITAFKEIDERALTSSEYTLRMTEDFFFGYDLKQGDALFPCSSLDKIFILWIDGRYKFVQPPDKMFVDQDFLIAGIHDRETVYTCVYVEPVYGFTYIKRFSWAGMIQNKEYALTPPKSKIILFEKGTPETIYLKYKPVKNQRVNQQAFNPAEVRISSTTARGIQMTPKQVLKISTERPRGWNDEDATAKGAFF